RREAANLQLPRSSRRTRVELQLQQPRGDYSAPCVRSDSGAAETAAGDAQNLRKRPSVRSLFLPNERVNGVRIPRPFLPATVSTGRARTTRRERRACSLAGRAHIQYMSASRL